MGPFKCPECGIWWAGIEHRCRPATVSPDANVPSPSTWPGGAGGTGSIPPRCGSCGGFHIPGQCPLFGTWCKVDMINTTASIAPFVTFSYIDTAGSLTRP